MKIISVSVIGDSVFSIWYTKAIDLGLVASLKYHIDNFHLLSRVNFGLADISDITFTDVNGQSPGDNKIRNMNFQLGVGYTFN